MIRTLALIALVGSGLLIAQSRSDTTTTAPPPTVATPTTTANLPIASPPPTHDNHTHHHAPDSTTPPPRAAATPQHYRSAARAFLTDFARPHPHRNPNLWWAHVAQHLSADALYAFTGTSPQSVPFTRILPDTRSTRISPSTMRVRVLTDAGWWTVTVTDTDAGIFIDHAQAAHR